MKRDIRLSVFLRRFFVGTLAILYSFFSVVVIAGSLDVGGDITSQVEVQGTIVNLGVSLGVGRTETEVSIGSTHKDLRIPGEYSSDINVNGSASGVSVLNTALSEGGGICAKVSIGSIAPGTCDAYKGQ